MQYVKGSFVIIPNRHVLHSLTPGALAIYVHLCDFSDERGACFPSRRALSERIGMSVDTVDRYLLEIERAGLVSKTARKREDGSMSSNKYQILLVGSRTDTQGVSRARAEGGSRTHAIAELTPVLTNSTKNNISSSPSPVMDTDFASFWKEYPRKIGKGTAAKAWLKLSKGKDFDPQVVILSVVEHKKLDQWSDERYIPHPTTFLNGRRWEDELSPGADLSKGAYDHIVIPNE